MATIRTNETQTERTKTGIITTVKEVITKKDGKTYNRYTQIGFTSIATNSDGKEYIDGPIGQALLNSEVA